MVKSDRFRSPTGDARTLEQQLAGGGARTLEKELRMGAIILNNRAINSPILPGVSFILLYNTIFTEYRYCYC